MKIVVSEPSVPKAKILTMKDVWGYMPTDAKERNKGMVVANSHEQCPIFEDIVPYKSATVVCKAEQQGEVEYWCDYVMGCSSVSQVKELKDGKVALRADYQCW